METVVAVLFGMAFGAILTKGFLMHKKSKTKTTTGSGGSGGGIYEDNQEVKEGPTKLEQQQQ